MLDEPTLIEGIDTFVCLKCNFVWCQKTEDGHVTWFLPSGLVTDLANCLDRIRKLADELESGSPTVAKQNHVATSLHYEVSAAKAALKHASS